MTQTKTKEVETRSFIEDKLLELYNIKDKEYRLQEKSLTWQEYANGKTRGKKKGEFRTQIGMVIKMQKDAEMAASMPEFNFIPLDDKGVKNRRIVKQSFKYWWYKSKTDKQIGKALSSATTNGTGVIFEGIKEIWKTVKTPVRKTTKIDGQSVAYIDFKEEKKLVYCGIWTECIPFRNFFINGTDIDNSTEAIVVRYYDRDQYLSEKKLDPRVKNKEDLNSVPGEWKWKSKTDGEEIGSEKNDNFICELEYWNSATDEYIVYANGVEVINSSIPYMHKELPFALFYDNKAEDRIWGIGEFELTEEDELAKDEYRTLTIKAVKASIGFLLKGRDSDLDIEDLEFDIQAIFETDDIDEIKHFAPNIPIQAISELENKLDNDIIAKTGVDYKSLMLAPSESATRTASKSNSSRKRINKNIKDNAYDFFSRLASLRMSNIQFLHTSGVWKIPIEGGSIDANGRYVKDETGSYGLARIGKKFIEGDFMVEPVIESMIGDSEERRKSNLDRFAQLFGGTPGDDGTPVIKGKQLVKLGAEEYGYDYEKLTEESEDSKNPTDIVNKIFGEKNGEMTSNDPQNPNNPNYVPPEQRSQKDAVKTISGQAKIRPEEEQ